MKLSDINKKQLLDSAINVYLAYTALDFSKTKRFSTSLGQKSLYELCTQAIANKTYDQTLLINNLNYRLVLTPNANNTFTIHFSRAIGANTPSLVKRIADYEEQEVLNVLVNQELILETPNDSAPCIANTINGNYVIGGAGKMDLYRTHLVTLHNIIEKIQSEEDISNLLVALATGSGKTFVQALWMFILSLSGNNGIFAVPDKLTTQFSKDLRRLLPDNFVNTLLFMREKEDNPQVDVAIKSLSSPLTSGLIMVGSAERLLDQYYQDLMEAHAEHTFLAFDEQHLIMKAERRRVRLIELSKKKLSMFLTATPNQETYQLAGNKPVAIMSSGQKQEAGQGQFPQLYAHHARNISDRNTLKDYRFWTSDFWQKMFNGFLLRVTNSFQEEQSSAAVSVVEDLPFYIHRKEGETAPRWRLQVPAARKMLCIIDDNESLVNFCYALEHAPSYRRDVYRNGNLINRADVANFFAIPDAEVEVIRQDMKDRRKEHKRSLAEDEKTIGTSLANKSLAEQLKDNIFHNLIEYVLTDLTGLDDIEHNRLRKNSFNDFKNLVINKFVVRTAGYYQQKLAKEIDARDAHDLGELLAELSGILKTMLDGTFAFQQHENDKALENFIDNWPLYDKLINKIKHSHYTLAGNFERYARSHLVMGVMTGMSNEETPIKESRPFFGLKHNSYNLYDNDGIRVPQAKKRKHTTLEILNDTTRESSFTPNYLNVSEDVADNYFRLGFVGVYVSNKKTEGFSDRNLHTVINIAEQRVSPNNSPETQVQGIGRNRGLDETIEPAYIHSLGRGQKTVFDLDNLQSDDYYPALFRAQEQFNQEFIEVLGEGVSKKIVAWIYANMEQDERLNPDRLKRQVLKYIAQALRELNNKNSHEIKLSRAQLTEVLNYAMKGISKEIDHLKKPYNVSTGVTLLGHFLNFVCECYYTLQRIPPALNRWFFSWFGVSTTAQGEDMPRHADEVYLKILSKTSFKEITGNLAAAMEFKNWLTRKAEGIIPHVVKNIDYFATAELLDQFKHHQKQFLEPLLTKWVIDSKQEKIREALAQFPDLIHLLKSNLGNLDRLVGPDCAQFATGALALLQQIPGLEDLTLGDIVNYPENMRNLQETLTQNPTKLLLNNPHLQGQLVKKLGNYLKGDFSRFISAFVSYPHAKKIQHILATGDNASRFIQHCLGKIINEELNGSPEAFFNELTHFFEIEECVALDNDLENLFSTWEALQTDTKENWFKSLDEAHTMRLCQMIQQQLLPILVNAYPLETREALLKEASDSVKIKELVTGHGTVLVDLMQNSPDTLPEFMFSRLIAAELPQAIDIPQQISNAKLLFATKIVEIIKAGASNFLIGKVQTLFLNSKPEYVYAPAVAEFLGSNDFLNAISIMLPYDQWLQLKARIRNDSEGTLAVAKRLIDKMMSTRGKELAPEELLQVFNQQFQTNYQSSEQAAKQANLSFAHFSAEIMANPFAALNSSIQDQYSQLLSDRALPLLACFIDDDLKKESFFAIERDNKTLNNFIEKNYQHLIHLIEENESQIKQTALNLINQLLPESSQLVIGDIIHPEKKALDSSMLIYQEMVKITLTTFLRSKVFNDLMKDWLNHEDFVLLMTYLNTTEYCSLLVDKMMVRGVSNLDKEALLSIIKSLDPDLELLTPMDDRANALKDYFHQQTAEIERHLDKAKVVDLLGDELSPVFFHEKFVGILDEFIGFLDEEDLTVLFASLNRPVPSVHAMQLREFIDIIRYQDKTALIQQFLTLSESEEGLDVQQLPIKSILDDISDLVQEILDCHCYYNQHDRKGIQYRNIAPRILDRVSPKLKEIRVSASPSFFSGFSRKIFYIQGINNGIEAAGQINADSNRHIIKELERVNSHILRPLWWGTNVSDFYHSFIKTCRNLFHLCVAGYFYILNELKSMCNDITESEYFNISSKHPDSEDYSDTAFAFAREINKLEPLSKGQVQEKDCELDVVIQLEEFVTKCQSRPGFFRDVSELVDLEEKNSGFTPK